MLRPGELVIDDSNWQQHVNPIVGGERKGHGLVPRDYARYPKCSSPYARDFASVDMPLIPRNEWPERIREMEATKSRLSDLRRTCGPGGGIIPSLDQGNRGYCWAHSGVMAAMLARALMGLPYVRLSAYMVACIIKNYQDEGGWGAHGLEFLCQHGVPSVEYWPEKSVDRSNDNPEMRANALLHRVVESWVDLDPPVYDRNLSEDQSMTALFCRCPLIADFNHWSHSVAILDPVLMSAKRSLLKTDFASLDLNNFRDLAIYAAVFGKRLINSWSDGWGDKGEGVLSGTKAILDGGAAIRVVLASAA